MIFSLKSAIVNFYLWSVWLWFVALCALLILAVCSLVLFRGRLRDFALLCCSVVVGLLALEAAGIWSASRQGGPITQRTGELFHKHKELGYAPAYPGQYFVKKWNPATGQVLYDVTYTIDKNLLRETRTAESGPVIAFFGDSMTFGEGANDADTMPQAIANLSNGSSQVFNFGFSGYSPAQFLRAMETGLYDSLLSNKELRSFVLMTAAWHTDRIFCRPYWVKYAPAYAMTDGRVQYQGSCSDGFKNRLRRFFERSTFYQAFVYPAIEERVSRDDLDLYLAVVAEGVKRARERYNAPTVVLYLAYHDEFFAESGSSNDEMIAGLKRSGADVIDVTPRSADGSPLSADPLFFIAGDGHPTPRGHAEIASKLWGHLAEKCQGCSLVRSRGDDTRTLPATTR
jgi:hypothetical protein